MQSLSHIWHVTTCPNFGRVGFYVKHVISHKYNNCSSFLDPYKISAGVRTRLRAVVVFFLNKAGGKYSDWPWKGYRCSCVACTEKVHERLRAVLTETMEMLLPLLMILHNRTLTGFKI